MVCWLVPPPTHNAEVDCNSNVFMRYDSSRTMISYEKFEGHSMIMKISENSEKYYGI